MGVQKYIRFPFKMFMNDRNFKLLYFICCVDVFNLSTEKLIIDQEIKTQIIELCGEEREDMFRFHEIITNEKRDINSCEYVWYSWFENDFWKNHKKCLERVNKMFSENILDKEQNGIITYDENSKVHINKNSMLLIKYFD